MSTSSHAVARPHTPSLARAIRNRYFRSPGDAVITLTILATLAWIVPRLFNWAVLKAVAFADTPALCQQAGGACWAVVTQRYFYILLGTYPYDQAWRPITVMVVLLTLVGASCFRSLRGTWLLGAWVAGTFLTYVLMGGGVFGLSPVDTGRWGGLPVTLILAIFSLAASLPLGILLALGRRSSLPALRFVCTAYIELMRGVPLVSVLFMASVMLPLFLPEGFTIDRLLRALVAFACFAAAYVAEVVRGGLNSIPKGQYEAATAMALGPARAYRFVILPQALKISIPALVNTFIEFFKDTSLVLVVGMLDLFNAGRSVLSDPAWLPYATEIYIFLGVVYFVFCFGMSKVSQGLEGRKG